MDLYRARSATLALSEIAAGSLSCERWVSECIDSYSRHEPTIQAFAHWSGEQALLQAATLDQSQPRGLLSGLPLAVKDIFDTADQPTTFNSPLYQGRQPAEDAACVALLRQHGAVVMGKSATVEFASLGRTAPTTNPFDRSRTPGGSSSGSAAAVAAGMASVALATQTGGSTIRPASFCGVAAIKPSYGVVPIAGMHPYAPSLDTVGWMARSVDDLMLVARVFGMENPVQLKPSLRIGFYPSPYWDCAQSQTRSALDWARAQMSNAGIELFDVPALPDSHRLNEAQNLIMHGEGRASFLNEHLRWPQRLHPALKDEAENALGITPAQMRWAYDYLGAMAPAFDQAMADCDAWLTPAVPGVAPLGLDQTGDAVFNRLWTGLKMPAITLPGYRDSRGLPVGIQLIGQRHEDWRLLQVAKLVESALASG